MGLRLSEQAYRELLRKKSVGTPAAPLPKPPRARSVGEVELERRLEEAGIAGWCTEYEFHPERRWKVDYAWPTERLAVEVEGPVHRTKGRFSNDLDKYNSLALRGWTLLRFDTRRIATGKAVETIRAALAAGGRGNG